MFSWNACSLRRKGWAIIWFIITFLFGASFLYIEISEFMDFIDRGASWQRRAFLSSFFTLVGTHGLHISIGLLWMVVMMFRIALRPLLEHSTQESFAWLFFGTFLTLSGFLFLPLFME